MTRRSSSKVSGGNRRKQRGGGGATGYVGCVTGGLNQVAAAGRGNELAYAPVGGCTTCQSGGRRKSSKRNRSKKSKRGGTLIGDIAVPAALVWANTIFGKRKSRKNRSSRRR